MTEQVRLGAITMWALDFVRAAAEQPLWLRILLRPVVGKSAYREFLGLVEELERNNFLPFLSYELECMEYHQDKMPLDWTKGVHGKKSAF